MLMRTLTGIFRAKISASASGRYVKPIPAQLVKLLEQGALSRKRPAATVKICFKTSSLPKVKKRREQKLRLLTEQMQALKLSHE